MPTMGHRPSGAPTSVLRSVLCAECLWVPSRRTRIRSRMPTHHLRSRMGQRAPTNALRHGVRRRATKSPMGRSRSPYRPGDGPGSGFSRWQSPFQPLCPRARAGSPRFPGDPSRDFAPVHDPGRPRCASPLAAPSGAAPTRLTMKASSFTDFEAARRFVTCRLRFTTGVTARHARLASGWRAAPLPGGSQTRWIATRGFSSCHPPLQGFPWRNNRSVMG